MRFTVWRLWQYRENFGMRFNSVFWESGGDQYTVSVIKPVIQ